jgi:hypothetical protein
MRKPGANLKQLLNNGGRISTISTDVVNCGGISARYPRSFFNVRAETAPVSPHQAESVAHMA